VVVVLTRFDEKKTFKRAKWGTVWEEVMVVIVCYLMIARN
jgi:hypothetical protein